MSRLRWATIGGLRTTWWHLAAVMVVLAMMAASAHTMTIASPAPAEQERMAREVDAATERAVVPNPAVSDGLAIPALVGGIVLAFAVGLTAGHVQRRRGAARRRAARLRPDPVPDPVLPARTAAIAPPPAPPPPKPAAPPRVVKPAPPPPPPPPPPPAPRRPEPVAAPPPTGPALGRAPEVPRREEAAPAWRESEVSLDAPEAIGPRTPVEADILSARRFAPERPWPEEAASLWTCEIAWKAGYVKSSFRAMAAPPGGDSRRKPIAESPPLRWTLMTDPEPPTPEMVVGVKALIAALVAAGWERTEPGAAWYAQRFLWRGEGEPGAVDVPEPARSAEPPTR